MKSPPSQASQGEANYPQGQAQPHKKNQGGGQNLMKFLPPSEPIRGRQTFPGGGKLPPPFSPYCTGASQGRGGKLFSGADLAK